MWESSHPDEWKKLKAYLDRERARALGYPYYAYFFRSYDYGKYYGEGLPPTLAATAPRLSEDFQEALKQMDAYVTGKTRIWTDLMAKFFGPEIKLVQ